MKIQYLALAAVLAVFSNLVFVLTRDDASNGREIRLGVLAPLSGDFASYGRLIQNGLELAQADLAAQLQAQGYTLRFIYEDTALPGPAAASAAQQLSLVSKVNGVAANFFNPVVPVAAPVLARTGTPMFHTAAADDVILNSGPLVYTTNARIRDEACRAAELARQELNAQRAAVTYVQTNFGESYQRHFVRCFEELGGKVVYNDGTPLSVRDFREVLLKLKASQPDVVFSGHFGTQLGGLIRQAREAGIAQQFIGVYESEDPSVLETAGGAAEGLLFFVPEPKQDSPARREFIEKFAHRFGSRPGILAANAYDAAQILSAALAQCRLDRACTQRALSSLKTYDGASGCFVFGADRAAAKEFVLKTIRRGQFERVQS